MMTDYATYSQEELEAEEAELAKQRTAVRIAQNEVAAELAIRKALASMPEGAREIVKLRLAGKLDTKGITSSTGADK